MEKSTFGERLAQILDERKLERKDLASCANISVQAISNYINGNRKPDYEVLAKISIALNVSADWLIGLSDVKSPDSSVQGIQRMTGLSELAIDRLRALKELAYDPDELNTPYHHGSISFINRIIEKSTHSIVGALYFDYQRAKWDFEDKEVLYAEKKEEYEKHFLGKEDFFEELSGKVRNAELSPEQNQGFGVAG